MDGKIQNRVLQLGTLNDELKRVIGLTNEGNSENAKLEEKKLELEKSVADLETRFSELKQANLSEERRHEDNLIDLRHTHKHEEENHQKNIDSILNFILNLENRKGKLKDEVAGLKIEEKRLAGVKGEVALLKEKKEELDKLNSDLAKLKNEMGKSAEAFDKITALYQQQKKKLADEKADHREWLKDTRKEIELELQKAKDSVAELLKTKRDLKVIERRLARKWKELYPNLAFPKIYG